MQTVAVARATFRSKAKMPNPIAIHAVEALKSVKQNQQATPLEILAKALMFLAKSVNADLTITKNAQQTTSESPVRMHVPAEKQNAQALSAPAN